MTQAPTEPLTWRGWLSRALIVLGFLLGTIGNMEYAALVGTGRLATIGAVNGPSPVPESRWRRIATVTPGGPADRLGLRPGEDFRYPVPFGNSLRRLPGERFPITILKHGRRVSDDIVVEAGFADPLIIDGNAIVACFSLISLALAALLLIRGGRRPAAILLAAIIVCLNWSPPTLGLPLPLAGAVLLAALFTAPFLLYSIPRFCLMISGGPPTAAVDRHVRFGALGFAGIGVYGTISNNLTGPLPAVGPLLAVTCVTAATALGFWAMALNFRRADSAMRNRILVVLFAFLCFGSTSVLSTVGNALLATGMSASQMLWVPVGLISAQLAAVSLLAYAVLKQRLLDVSFAINRTLVYGAVSFTLLAGFGLAEWGADRLVPESWHKQSALYSAGVALLLFLSFHRVRDWFERHVERLFFAGWQRAQADLKRFVASAGHFRQAPALCREFVAEVARFAQGAPAALYLREDGGGFVRQCGGLADAAESYGEEDRLFPLLNAERVPVDLTEAHSALPGAMAFPMLDQLGLAGFVLLGPRPDGAHYRPDEIDNLAWATQQVGLDLQALQARELREEVATLREQLAGRTQRRRNAKVQPLRTISITGAA